jgi:hypothetical protein
MDTSSAAVTVGGVLLGLTNSNGATTGGVLSLSNAGTGAAMAIAQTGAGSNLTMTNTAATASNLVSISQSTSAYTGTALLMNIAAGSGSFASGNFIDLQKNSVSQFKVDNAGVVTGGAYNGLTLASAADGFTVAGGTTSRTLTVTGAAITIGSTITPTAAGAIAINANRQRRQHW